LQASCVGSEICCWFFGLAFKEHVGLFINKKIGIFDLVEVEKRWWSYRFFFLLALSSESNLSNKFGFTNWFVL
jgi:hypothetical protein